MTPLFPSFSSFSWLVSSLDCPGVRVRGRGIVPRWRAERRRGARGNDALQNRARICKPSKEPRNRFPAWRADTDSLFVVLARQAT
jgi:hypothetical protein